MVFERIVEVDPAFDRRSPDPHQNYGIRACNIRFMVKGNKGVVQFVVQTDWFLPAVQDELKDSKLPINIWGVRPDGIDVGYHSYAPLHEWQDSTTKESCPYLDGHPCYYDGSGLRAVDWVPDFLSGGTAWLWPQLEGYYNAVFGEGE